MCNARPCKCSCDLVPVKNDYGAVAHGPIGAFAWSVMNIDGMRYGQLKVKLPNEGGQFHGLPVYLEGEERRNDITMWQWDGNLEKPTLTPSIRTQLLKHKIEHDGPYTDADMEESWHGHITAGRAVSCA